MKNIFIIIFSSILALSCSVKDKKVDANIQSKKNNIEVDSSSFPENYKKVIDSLGNIYIDSLQCKISIRHLNKQYLIKHVIDTLIKIDSIFMYDKVLNELSTLNVRTYPNGAEIGKWMVFKNREVDSIIDKDAGLLVNYYTAIDTAKKYNFKFPNIEFIEGYDLGSFNEKMWMIKRTNIISDSVSTIDSILFIGSKTGYIFTMSNSNPLYINKSHLNQYEDYIKRLGK